LSFFVQRKKNYLVVQVIESILIIFF